MASQIEFTVSHGCQDSRATPSPKSKCGGAKHKQQLKLSDGCRRGLALFLLLVVVFPCAATAETPLGTEMYALLKTARNRGAKPEEIADIFVDWMANNDWRSMDIHDHYNLYSLINLDALDRCHFSAKWSGFLTAPASAEYTLRLLPVYRGENTRVRVSIGGEMVIDSGVSSSTEQLASGAIRLSQGQPVPVEVTLTHDVSEISNFGENAPMLVLAWQRPGSKETIIPTSAYTPPADFAAMGSHGLRGDYFASADFKSLCRTRLDPALDFVWSWPPVTSIHHKEADELLAACTSKILNREFLAQGATDRNLELFDYNLWRIAYRMTGTQRQELVELLRSDQSVLKVISHIGMGRLMQAIYMLPSGDQLDLLGEWSLARPDPKTVAGQFPGWDEGCYREANTDYYWLMGQFLRGPYANGSEKLRNVYFERENGACNTSVVRALAYADRANGNFNETWNELSAKVDSQDIQGDALVPWLIARAFAADIEGGSVEPLRGFDDLESAYVAAESDEMKLWALQEMVARLSSVDLGEKAKALIEENRSRLSSPQATSEFANWSLKADELTKFYIDDRADQYKASQKAYVEELKRRRQGASERDNIALANRLSDLIEASEVPE